MVARLTEFRIKKLFGLYCHRIEFKLQERITIIIGPNGRGKTVCLKFIEALFRKKLAYFSDIPFEEATFSFEDGQTIKVQGDVSKMEGEDRNTGRSVRMTLTSTEGDETEWSPAMMDRATNRELQRFLPSVWRPNGFDSWIDANDGEEITNDELVRRYHLPPNLAALVRQDMPEPLANLIGAIDCHLIETQRLLVLPAEDESDRSFTIYGRPRRSRVSQLAIQQKAEKLKAILSETLARYANLSQSLDRTFPLRVFEAQGSAKLSEDDLRNELKKLDQRRDALMTSGIVDTDYQPVSLRAGRSIEPGVAMALEIYVKDTTNKLDLFNEILAKVDLLKDLVSSRFIDKTLHIDRESGFRITSSNGSGVPLDKLSSGEQHQLILIFDLLFEVTRNSLILIDEPELSLHVAWQKSFIDSLSRIIALNGFDVLLATHSPAIVATHFDLAVELGPVDC